MTPTSPVGPTPRRRLLAVSQKVVDIKVQKGPNGLAARVGGLLNYLIDRRFVKAEKLSATMIPESVDPTTGVFTARLTGSSFMPDSAKRVVQTGELDDVLSFETALTIRLGLGLKGYAGPLEIQSIFRAVTDTSVDDGGNIQNMTLNLALLATGLARRYPLLFGPGNFGLTVASSSDPLEKVPEALRAEIGPVIEWFKLDLPNRFAIQLPCEGLASRLSITSEPARTPAALEKLIAGDAAFANAFANTACFVSSDPIFQVLGAHARPPFAYVINASTAFRALVAAESYGHHAILTQNQKEAADVLRLLMARGLQQELGDTEELPFPSPIRSDGAGLDEPALALLDLSLDQFMRSNPLFRSLSAMTFDFPFTFGPEGGLLVGSGKHCFIVFSTVPPRERQGTILDAFADPAMTHPDETNEVGAGDSVAAVLALFNTVDPSDIVKTKMHGDQSRHTELVELASTIFVSLVGRLVGNLLVRTRHTYLANSSTEKLCDLVDEAATEAVILADRMFKTLNRPAFGEIERWGIKVAVWVPGTVRRAPSVAE